MRYKNIKNNKVMNTLIIILLIVEVVVLFNYYKKYTQQIKIDSVEFAYEELTIQKDEIVKLNFTSVPEVSATKFKWTSDNNSIKIDNRGYVRGTEVGTGTITIELNNHRDTCKVTVVDNEVAFELENEKNE